MAGVQTERKLAELLKTIADFEKEVEIVRQVLAEQSDFEPFTAFKRIDSLELGYIRVCDLHQFLKDNGIYPTEKDILRLFHLFDTNGDQRISYTNFLDATLPCTSPALRKLATQRASYSIGKNETLPYDVEWSLSRVFDKEIEASRQIEMLKEELIKRYDFDLLDAFKKIDIYRLGHIDQEALTKFFQRNKIKVSDEDILALLRRMDRDRDGKVSYAEFGDVVTPLDPYYRVTSRVDERKSNRSANNSPTRSSHRTPSRSRVTQNGDLSPSIIKPRDSKVTDFSGYLERSVSRSPSRNESLSKSYVSEEKIRQVSPSRSDSRQYSPTRALQRLSKAQVTWSPNISKVLGEDDGYRTPPRGNSPARRSFSRERSSPLKGREEEHLAEVLKDEIELDKQVEELRNELSLKSDFNLLDAFKVFDVNGRGAITAGEFEDGLKELGIYPTRDELYLIVRKFDKDSDGRLKYSEFSEIFIPNSPEYAGKLTRRIPSYRDTRTPKTLFVYDTRRVIQKFFNVLFQNESIIENIRQKLNKRPLFDLYDAFKALDKNDKGYVTLEEFKEVLNNHGIYSSSNELMSLLQRFDKNQDGKVSYSDFVSEISPKSPTKY